MTRFNIRNVQLKAHIASSQVPQKLKSYARVVRLVIINSYKVEDTGNLHGSDGIRSLHS
jgi:hypothetical protein